MKELILKLKSLLATLTLDAVKKAEVEAQILALETAEADTAKKILTQKTEPIPAQTVVLPPEVTAALSEINTVKDMLVKQQQRADAAELAMKNQMIADSKKKVDDYIKKVVEVDKKISPAEMKEKWQPLLENAATFDAACKIIDALPVHPSSRQTKTNDGKKTDEPADKNTSLKNYVDNKQSFDANALAALTTANVN